MIFFNQPNNILILVQGYHNPYTKQKEKKKEERRPLLIMDSCHLHPMRIYRDYPQ